AGIDLIERAMSPRPTEELKHAQLHRRLPSRVFEPCSSGGSGWTKSITTDRCSARAMRHCETAHDPSDDSAGESLLSLRRRGGLRPDAIDDLFRRFGKAFNKADVEEIAACVTDDFEWRLAAGARPSGTVLKGKDDLRRYFGDRSQAHREARYSEARI